MRLFKFGMVIVLILALLPIGFYNNTIAYAQEKQDTVRVGLESKYKSVSSVAIQNPKLILEAGGQQYPLSSGSSYQITVWNGKETTIHKSDFPGTPIPSGAKLLQIKWGSGSMIVENTMDFQIRDANNAPLDLGGGKYRGALAFAVNGNQFTLVNVISVEAYLYGVVPSEMPSSWSLEALKAQAVAARTYTLSRASAHVHSKAGYDLCDTTHCQVYTGTAKETASTTQAVKETTGMEAYYDNKPINAVFFSSSGGITDQSENAWGSPVPYLKSVVELNETAPKEWSRTFTLSEITTLAKNKGYNIGNVTGISIGKVENERVVELLLHGSSGQKTIKGEEIRTFFSATSGGMLYSRYFRIGESVPAIVKTSQPKEFAVVEERKESESEAQNENKNYFVYEKNELQSTKPSFAYVYNDGSVEAVAASVTAVGKNGTVTYDATIKKETVQQTTAQKPQETIFETPSYIPSVVSTKVHTESTIVLNGKGWGHGVGMSQTGAKGMAEIGYNYKEILSYYYTGIEIK